MKCILCLVLCGGATSGNLAMEKFQPDDTCNVLNQRSRTIKKKEVTSKTNRRLLQQWTAVLGEQELMNKSSVLQPITYYDQFLPPVTGMEEQRSTDDTMFKLVLECRKRQRELAKAATEVAVQARVKDLQYKEQRNLAREARDRADKANSLRLSAELQLKDTQRKLSQKCSVSEGVQRRRLNSDDYGTEEPVLSGYMPMPIAKSGNNALFDCTFIPLELKVYGRIGSRFVVITRKDRSVEFNPGFGVLSSVLVNPLRETLLFESTTAIPFGMYREIRKERLEVKIDDLFNDELGELPTKYSNALLKQKK